VYEHWLKLPKVFRSWHQPRYFFLLWAPSPTETFLETLDWSLQHYHTSRIIMVSFSKLSPFSKLDHQPSSPPDSHPTMGLIAAVGFGRRRPPACVPNDVLCVRRRARRTQPGRTRIQLPNSFLQNTTLRLTRVFFNALFFLNIENTQCAFILFGIVSPQ